MKNIAAAVAFVAIAMIAGTEADAQSFSFNNGYQFGAGLRSGGGYINPEHPGMGMRHPRFGFAPFFSRGFTHRTVRPPYFAEFPPVYYSGIVRRPYGISPYAAPAGIAPVELGRAASPVEPVAIKNPFFGKNNSSTVSVREEEAKAKQNEATKNKSTRVANPYFESAPEAAGPVMHASYDVFEDN